MHVTRANACSANVSNPVELPELRAGTPRAVLNGKPAVATADTLSDTAPVKGAYPAL
jgi:hypothetical protein